MEIRCNFCRARFLNPIDNLEYQYSYNKLLKVIDQSNSIDGFRDGQNADPARPDYSYDLNGNMTQDWNKGISEITYNHLNLPTRIIFNYDVNKKIDYLYNALGVKLKKVVDDKTVTPNVYQETHYLGGFQYVGDYLQFFPTAEGYVSVKESNYNYVYNYKDHLGNIRLSYTSEGSVTKVLEENHYYPFGMKHSYNADIREWGLDRDTGEVYAIVEEVDRSNYQYKYNGKEYQDELGLNFYDYGARNYDPALGRWMNIDPLAEQGRRWSPYAYAFDNPVYFIDPDGMWPKMPSWSDVKKFATGFGKSAIGMVKSAAAPLGMASSRSLVVVARQVAQGNTEAAMATAKEATGVPGTVRTVKAAIKGDPEAIGSLAAVVVGVAVTRKLGAKPVAAAEAGAAEMSALNNSVRTTAAEMKAAGQSPATVVGAELNGQTAIATSGKVPATIAPQLEVAAGELGGVGTRTASGNTVGCCGEFNAANQLLLQNPTAAPTQVRFTDAIRPRTGEVVPPCQNCQTTFGL